ncbi:hypothetical protein FOA52_015544 [Chlamydomonas sp. UWO 241]|nr:hypothetical protein FOA52_015544 [Chlamydomonas sp. UWO 241]
MVALSIAFLLFDSSLFSWHPLFMSIGYVLFMTEGLLAAIMFRHLDGPERVAAIQSHAIMQIRALVCIVIGFVVIYQNKVQHNKRHFQSTHSQVGLATLVLTVLAPLGGAISFKRLGLIHRFPEVWHSRIKWLHRKLGVCVWLLALVTIELALPHPSVRKALLTPLWQAGVALVGVLLLAIAAKAQVKFKQDDADAPGHDHMTAKAV